jgi:hypothetical protein
MLAVVQSVYSAVCASARKRPEQGANMGSELRKDLTMNHTKTIRTLFLSLSLAAGIFAAPAYARVDLSINIAPPAPQYEVVPVMAPGYAWAPGYWGWSGERHVWVRGRPIMQREGYRWEPDRWEQRGSGYYRTVGNWQRDNAYRSRDNGNHGHGNNGKHGGGNKHGD